MTRVRSATSAASAGSWVTHTVVVAPSVARSCRSSAALSCRAVTTSRWENGSSTRSSGSWQASARAIETRCRMPPDRVSGYASVASARPTRASHSAALPRSALASTSSTFSRAVRHGSSRGSWNTTGTRPLGRSRPPDVGPTRPATVRRSVVFPAPERPITARTWPRGTMASSSCSNSRPRRTRERRRKTRAEPGPGGLENAATEGFGCALELGMARGSVILTELVGFDSGQRVRSGVTGVDVTKAMPGERALLPDPSTKVLDLHALAIAGTPPHR